ncbi:MAG TPA: DUF3611 family protein [Oscillatoriales cyanobacterium M59_W2019_021]|nr:DUF3611 family protein [Oscillatoriales cyanobacterium M4454_W2019_049]HIK51824.1 DUF3611 family protein [Oscillatoriales cyanobacterium M59_W2019_021]
MAIQSAIVSNPPQSRYLPPTVERAIPALRRVGHICRWAQGVLGLIATFSFLFAVFVAASGKPEGVASPESGLSGFLAIASLAALGIGFFWSSRYIALSRQLANPEARPKKSETLLLIERGLIINLVGMLFSLLAAETIAGFLMAKAALSSGVTFSDLAQKTLIQPVDVLVLLANTQTLVAHFTGLVASLWLLRWLNKS